jgi:hypothetical protein
MVKEFPAFYATAVFIAVFTTACHLKQISSVLSFCVYDSLLQVFEFMVNPWVTISSASLKYKQKSRYECGIFLLHKTLIPTGIR